MRCVFYRLTRNIKPINEILKKMLLFAPEVVVWMYQLDDDGLVLELTGKGTKY